MKVAAMLFVGACLCTAQKPDNCLGSPEQAQQCLQQGLDIGSPQLAFALGNAYYLRNEAFQQDYEKAAKWFRLAALRGHLGAQASLGLLYATGEGVPQDYAAAFRWSGAAAESGDAMAQALVGSAYLWGRSVPQDYKAAAQWLRKSAEQGEMLGEMGLGLIYERGWGVSQDYVQAHMWLNLASAQARDKDVARINREHRDDVATKMTPAQIAEAQRLAQEFKAKAP